MKEIKHSFMNYPTSSTKKCTRCGMIKKTRGGKSGYGTTVIFELNGIIYNEYQPCKTFTP